MGKGKMTHLEADEESQDMTMAGTKDNGDGAGEVWEGFQVAQQSATVKCASSIISPEETQDIRMSLGHI